MSFRDVFIVEIEEIYREYHDRILSYIMYKVGNREDSEDICSEVFIKIQKNIDKFDQEKGSLSRWVYVIAGNAIIDYYRSHKAQEELPEDLPEEGDIEEDILNRETLSELTEALTKLSDEERKVIVLHYYEGLSLKEIERKTGMTYGKVKLRHNSALAAMKKFIVKRAANDRFRIC